MLLLTAFVLRALIPPGFMPKFFEAGSQTVKFVICSAHGLKSIVTDANGDAAPGKPAAHFDPPCAFSGLLAFSLPVPEAVDISGLAFEVTSFLPNLSVTLPPPRAGPMLGSRGPPHVL